MPLPPEFDTVTVTGKFVTPQGDPIVGKVKFTASPTALISDLNDTVIVPVVVEVDLDVNGSFAAELPATTDPDINPQDWTYKVEESFAGGRAYHIELPLGGGPFDLSEVAPVPSSDGEAIVRGPQGEQGPQGDPGPAPSSPFTITQANDEVPLTIEVTTGTAFRVTNPGGSEVYLEVDAAGKITAPNIGVKVHTPVGAADPAPAEAQDGDLILRYTT